MAERSIGGSRARPGAGESAQAEYERRAALDAERRRAGRTKSIVLVALAPVAGYVAARLGAVLLDAAISATTASLETGASPGPIFEDSTLHVISLAAAALATLWVIAIRFGPRQSTEAWRVGAEGEQRTGRSLDALPPEFRIFHDLKMPNSRANIDHVVVGPTGVFTIETKNYAKGVTIRQGVARSSGRKLDSVVEQAKRQASAVSDWVGTDVIPIVCVHGQGVRVEGWFGKPTVSGVHFCSGRRLTRLLTKRPTTHTEEAVSSAVGRIERR